MTSLHPGVTGESARAATGWPLLISPSVVETHAPTRDELQVLRSLTAAGASHDD
jgi:glutaconate CoA-transferase, subunit B